MNNNINQNEQTSATMFSDYPDVVSVEQVTEMLHIGQVLAYKLLKDGVIKARKVGRRYIIAKKNVIEFLSEAS
ncbi:MAG: helix-turn-helix domain-containing protein [Clostridiales bacterium]|nr:helix-turn-helix domain-containing protein [Clostridiales bacterium]